MTAYTDTMVAEMTKIGSFDYDSASAFASEYGLSVRSVISKCHNLGLEYTPREKAVAASAPRVRKSDIVAGIAASIEVNTDVLAGLAKADMASLQALAVAIEGR